MECRSSNKYNLIFLVNQYYSMFLDGRLAYCLLRMYHIFLWNCKYYGCVPPQKRYSLPERWVEK